MMVIPVDEHGPSPEQRRHMEMMQRAALRDYFAQSALTGMLSNLQGEIEVGVPSDPFIAHVAEVAYKLGEAMVNEREKYTTLPKAEG